MDSDDESDNYDYSDLEITDNKHDKLVEDILNLNKIQNLRKPTRTEPSLQISEFNLVKSATGNKGAVHLNQLTQVLKNRKKLKHIDGHVKQASKTRTLPKPLEKPQAERIRRMVAYEKSRLVLDKWEATVTSNRASANLSFPLARTPRLKMKPEDCVSQFRIKSDLEKEQEKLEPVVEVHHVDVEKEEFRLTAKELKERRKEAAKLRAHQTYKEAKARRTNKIKSKKYHRFLRREKIKQKLKEFEQLQVSNPEEALKKLEEIEKARAQERFSLRHRGTGQWAKSKQFRAKYDRESRKVLAEQLSISRDLTKKIKSTINDSDNEDVEESQENGSVEKHDEDNPWVSTGIKPTKDVLDFVSGYRKFWNEQNRLKDNNESEPNEIFNPVEETNCDVNGESEKKIIQNVINTDKKVVKKERNLKLNDSKSTSDWEVSDIQENRSKKEDEKTKTVNENKKKRKRKNNELDIEDIFNEVENKLNKKLKTKLNSVKAVKKETKKTKTNKKEKKKKIDYLKLPNQSKKKPIIDEEMIEEPTKDQSKETTEKSLGDLKKILQSSNNNSIATTNQSDIDPEKFITTKKTTNLKSANPDLLEVDDNAEVDQQAVIMEAFEDDDIIQDFTKEKSEEIDKNTPKDIDITLPGWGSWGGANIKPNPRKQKRFIIRMPKQMPRKDDNKGALIINEDAATKIREHMVSEVPFPFKTVRDFEASIRAPISNTFVPETAYKRFIRSTLKTKMGAVIEPLSRDVIMTHKKN